MTLGRAYSPATLALWLDRIFEVRPHAALLSRILDLGCGTGRYSGPLANHFNANVIAIDRSEKMLAEARQEISTASPLSTRRWRIAAAARRVGRHGFHVDGLSSLRGSFARGRANVTGSCERAVVVCLRAGTFEKIPTYPYVPFFRQEPRDSRSHAAKSRTYRVDFP